MTQEVAVERKLLKMPTLDDPSRQVYMITYTAGELPPRIIYIAADKWSEEEEAKRIKADIQKRMSKPKRTISI